ncbi:hypothetical protein L1987_78028 [Smallanthus sonchifolius]|uniref:Uncharacterized protein n=1 Tax=Smallanthus sonchifolius TaxID=185202 RepID=A0ACB8ZCL8_9ASTR|nr:hypothetical protein L1987_78028 [Smallanthus sonchifolius]
MATKKRDEAEAETRVSNGGSHEKRKKIKHKTRDKEQKNVLMDVTPPTVSIALPGSIIDNNQSFELATRLAGQIARAATIFRIDEVSHSWNKLQVLPARSWMWGLVRTVKGSDVLPDVKIFCYSMQQSLCVDSKFNMLVKSQSIGSNVVIDQALEPGTRVTVAMGTDRRLDDQPRPVVSSSKPREEAGIYWGYKVRYSANISSVLKCCPYKGGYDYLIGTSEHGNIVKSSELQLPSFRHLLIAFGGVAGLEECFDLDKNLKGKKPRDVFSTYLNICPHQGSRTIRTEEAIFICLQYFQEPIDRVLHGCS